MLETALSRFDEANQEDSNTVQLEDGTLVGKEWLYGRRMSECLQMFAPDSSEALQLAVRSQHLQRWVIPRSDYPAGRVGYNQWRQAQGRFHAHRAGEILQEVGYPAETIERVQSLLQKKRLKQDAEAQTLEDVACLVFLQYYLEPFAAKHSEEKLQVIIQKTWAKMSAQGQQAALKRLPELPAALQQLLTAALA